MKENLSARDQFFSKLSHDLRGSFTSMLGFSDILNDPNEKLTLEEISEYVSRIGSQTKESYELLLNFINWLKLDTFKYGLAKENFELLDLILQTKTYYKKIFLENKIDVKLEIDEKQKLNIDYEIANSIFNNVFLFLNQITSNGNEIKIKSMHKVKSNFINIEFTTKCVDKDLSFLQNIKLEKLNSDVSYPIIFAIKFTELSGGNFDFYQDEKDEIKLVLSFPSA
ncbi:MAG: HAMP domain-containing histidine kinase [Ignavibacteriae bacterium]|nr:HAMP domain-containing histidine kinase [Ignavibacteriota bacterium]